MKVRSLLCVCALFFSLTVAAQFQMEKYPKREFRAAWIQAVNGQFREVPTEKLKQTLISQLNSLQEAALMPSFSRCDLRPMLFMPLNWNRGAVS